MNYCKTGSWKPCYFQSSDLHQTVTLSDPHSSLGKTTAGMMLMPRSPPAPVHPGSKAIGLTHQERSSTEGVLSRTEIQLFMYGKTSKGVLRRNGIQIKEVALPVSKEPANPFAPNRERSRPPQTTMFLIVTKPPSPQSTTKPRTAAKSPGIQHTLSAVYTNQQAVIIPKTIPDVQTSVPQPHPMVSDNPIVPLGLAIIIKPLCKVSVHKAQDPVQKDTINLRRSSRVSKSNRKYLDVVSIVKNTLIMIYGFNIHNISTTFLFTTREYYCIIYSHISLYIRQGV